VNLFEHIPHPHVDARREAGPVRVADQHQAGSLVGRVNTRIALAITKTVGTMWCAYAFAGLAFTSLPQTIAMHSLAADVSWVAQTFLQLVLLAVIMVGQDVQAKASDDRAEQTFLDAEAVLHEAGQIQQHLHAQDELLARVLEHSTSPAALERAVRQTATRNSASGGL
jgi:hypothetical protein